MNFPLFHDEICDRIEVILLCYWSKRQAAGHQPKAERPRQGTDHGPLQLHGAAQTGVARRRSDDSSRQGFTPQSFRPRALENRQQQPGICGAAAKNTVDRAARAGAARSGLRVNF